MNASVVAATKTALYADLQILGVRNGFDGLIDGNLITLRGDVKATASRGGSFLHTARSKRFKTPDGVRAALSVLRSNQIEGVIIIGGNGSIAGARALHEHGVPVIAIPATIDNDIAGTDYTIGFDTACNHTVRVVNDIMDTATALEGRIFLVETLGLPTGFIAYASALAVGADFYLIPEIPADLNMICDNLQKKVKSGHGYAIGIISEAVGSAIQIAAEIEARIGERVRPTVIGHAQRGGSPTFFDRALAESLGSAATKALINGVRGKMVALTRSTVRIIDIYYPLEHSKLLSEIPLFNEFL